jgi:cysteine-rich repeat protein
LEPGYKCLGSGPSKCITICGDGLRLDNEECDDGGLSGGCSNECKILNGWVCSGGN